MRPLILNRFTIHALNLASVNKVSIAHSYLITAFPFKASISHHKINFSTAQWQVENCASEATAFITKSLSRLGSSQTGKVLIDY